MSDIPHEFNQQLVQVLLQCAPLGSDRELRTLFSNALLAAWRDDLPDSSNSRARAEALMAFLVSRANNNGENGLVLFLYVLHERMDPRDACQARLRELGVALARHLRVRHRFPARIFIGYRRNAERDRALADYLYQFLTDRGHQLFIDRTLRAGAEWLNEIDQQIKAADFLLVLLSPDSVNSEMLQAEVSRAYAYRQLQGHPAIIPVRVNYHDLLPYAVDAYLSNFQYVSWESEADNELVGEQIMAALAGAAITPRPLLPSIQMTQPAPPAPAADPRILERLTVPGGTMRPDDPFYVARPQDEALQRQLHHPGSIVTIRAARQTGKSSLLMRGVQAARAQGQQTVYLDLQRMDHDRLGDQNEFLHYVASFLARQLRLDNQEVERMWRSSFGPQDRLTYLLEDTILPALNAPLLLALDEADRLLQTGYYTDFFGLLRAWHNSAAYDALWQKLSLVMVISTEPYLLIPDPNQSPFNVGLKLYLQDFDRAQLHDLNRRHNEVVQPPEFEAFRQLFGGHPYLTRKAMYTLLVEKQTWPELQQIAATDHGPFSDHLRRQLWLLHQEPALQQALRQVIRQNRCDDEASRFRLLRAGLIKGAGSDYRCRCDLYRLYFQERL